MRTRIQKIFREGIELRQSFLEKNLDVLQDTILDIAETIRTGKKILFFGNGGSAADAQHFAAEFVNRYMIDRPPLAAIALTTDTSILTAISNDFSYDEIFEKQVKALGVKGDAAIGISTSGTSRNVLRGLETAQNKGLLTIGIGGPEKQSNEISLPTLSFRGRFVHPPCAGSSSRNRPHYCGVGGSNTFSGSGLE